MTLLKVINDVTATWYQLKTFLLLLEIMATFDPTDHINLMYHFLVILAASFGSMLQLSSVFNPMPLTR